MPQGKGTYGSKVGRPSKKARGGKKAGGNVGMSVDPFSTKNPEGVPAEQVSEATEKQNMSENILNAIPTTDAMNRSEVSPDMTEYKEGGPVEYVDVKDKSSGDYTNPARKKKGIKGTLERIVPGGKSGYEKKSVAQMKKESKGKKPKMRKSYTVDWGKRPGKGQFVDKDTGKNVKIKPKKKDKK